ncbi:MAG TPA: glutamine amidotransferase [Phycisphaerae bacterium]|nr:glutamine amidotransferase [Phycisphaerae bacterium]
MRELSIQFEPTSAAIWLWSAVAVLVALEMIRFSWLGRRPPSRGLRITICGGLAFVAGVALQRRGLRFDESTHVHACLTLAVLSGVWLTRAYRRTTRDISGGNRAVLLLLRIAAAVVVLLILAGPVLQITRTSREKPVLGIAVDDSRSMSIRDAKRRDSRTAPVSRSAAVQQALDGSKPTVRELGDRIDIRWFTFGSEARPSGWPALKADGDATALADAVQQVRAALTRDQRPIAAVILISDGRDTASGEARPESAAAELGAAGIPLYTVGAGSEMPLEQTRSLLLRRLDTPEQAAVLNQLPVHAEILATGLADQSVTVKLLLDDETVQTREVRPAGSRDLLRVDLTCVPKEPGLHRVTARAHAPGLPDGAETSRFVRVVDDRIPVLYIDRPRYERAAIIRALTSAGELRVTAVDPSSASGTSDRPGLPRTPEQWREMRVILLGDVGPGALGADRIAAMAEAVRQGSALALLGGVHSFGSDGYARTPLQAALPVDLGRMDEVSLSSSFELTPAGRSHPICRLDADAKANEQRWMQFPLSDRVTVPAGAAPASEVLLQAPGGRPLLAVRETGGGRTAAVAFDCTWRWSFTDEQGAESLRRFWRQLVLWLADRRPEAWVRTDRQQYELAEIGAGRQAVRITAGLRDPVGRPIATIPLTAVLHDPAGKELPVRLSVRDDAHHAEAKPLSAGDYRITVSADSADHAISPSQTAFVVTQADRELADPLPDLQMLRRMAAETRTLGGEYTSLDGFQAMLDRIAGNACPVEIRHSRRWHLVREAPWAWYAVFIGLLSLEWVLRRLRGLI